MSDNLLNYHRENPIHESKHIEEMKQIAHEMIQKEVPPIVEDIYNRAIKNLIGAIQYDIKNILDISVKDFQDMVFHDERIEKVVSAAISKSLQSTTLNHDFNITF